MNILVTGGAGFIGSHIVEAYLQKGHKVWIVDDESSGQRANVNKKARYVKLDIRRKDKLENLFRRCHVDIVNHHAAQIDVRRSVADPRGDAGVNIFGTLNLLDLAKRYRVRKFLFASSGGTIYGECAGPARESMPERPLSPYGISKLASEKYIQSFAHTHNLKFTIFRYANVYGPRQDPFGEAGVVAIFSKQLLDGRPCVIYGDGMQTRDFVFVRDVARASYIALRKGANQIVNIGTGKETSVKALYRIMARIVGSERKPVFKAGRPGELFRSVLNAQGARRILKWTPRVSLFDGLKETLHYFRGGIS